MEYPLTESRGVCPRGSTLGQLVGHPRRILSAKARRDGRLREISTATAMDRILQAAGQGGITILLDGNLPCEQLVQAAAWCAKWSDANLCFVIEPAERQLLLGMEASGCDYLADDALAACDAFLIVGDAMAANPACSRGVFDRRREQRRTPVVVIDPASGTAAKFATQQVAVSPGEELAALAAVASGAGLTDFGELPPGKGPPGRPGAPGYRGGDPLGGDLPGAKAAGKALAGAKRLGILVAAEYGRGGAWRQIGYLAGRLASAHGGGVAPQTTGANALAAVRLADRLRTVSLAQVLSSPDRAVVAVGCDVIGMLGLAQMKLAGAAAALPNETTQRAQIILPTAMTGEFGGTYLLGGAKQTQVSAVLAAPMGIPTPGEVVAALAAEAGVSGPLAQKVPAEMPPLSRVQSATVGKVPAEGSPPRYPGAPGRPGGPFPVGPVGSVGQKASAPTLLLGRQAMHSACGGLTAHGSWQTAAQPDPEVRICPDYAAQLGVTNLSFVSVRGGQPRQDVRARVRFAPELSPGLLVLPESLPQARAMMPILPRTVDAQNDAIVSGPAAVEVGSS